jgi:hypothetical protein
LAAFAVLQAGLLLILHSVLICLNRTTWELLKSGTVDYMKEWHSSYSPFSRGIHGNIREFVTMRWTPPVYEIPKGDRLEQWKKENSFLVNDRYECC